MIKITREQLDQFLIEYKKDAAKAIYARRRIGMISFIPTFEDYFKLQNTCSKEWKSYPHRETQTSNFKIKMSRAEMLLKYWLMEKGLK